MDQISEKAQGGGKKASKEVNKEIAKDPNVRTSDRLRAMKDAAGDKVDQHKHESAAKMNKERAKH